MADCCHTDYRKVFRTAEGFRDTKAYLRRGLRGTEKLQADLSRALPLEGPSLIEVGAGAGVLHTDLLRSGASTATAVDISAGWNDAAASLLASLDLGEQVTRVVGDFVDEAPSIEPADVVLLHRVICCYEDWTALVDAAAGHAGNAVIFTIPREGLTAKLTLWAFNAWLRIQRCGFRAFVHPVDEILGRFSSHGFAVTAKHTTVAWVTYRVERT